LIRHSSLPAPPGRRRRPRDLGPARRASRRSLATGIGFAVLVAAPRPPRSLDRGAPDGARGIAAPPADRRRPRDVGRARRARGLRLAAGGLGSQRCAGWPPVRLVAAAGTIPADRAARGQFLFADNGLDVVGLAPSPPRPAARRRRPRDRGRARCGGRLRLARGERRATAESITQEDGGTLRVRLSGDRTIPVDEVVGLTGCSPDLSMLSELAIEIDPATEGAARLARALSNVTD
jgi:hypothetical protein